MKKLVCILAVICFSVSIYAKGSGRRYSASVDNAQVVKAQKAQRASLRSFSARKYSSITGHRGFHPFGRRSGGSAGTQSGLGL